MIIFIGILVTGVILVAHAFDCINRGKIDIADWFFYPGIILFSLGGIGSVFSGIENDKKWIENKEINCRQGDAKGCREGIEATNDKQIKKYYQLLYKTKTGKSLTYGD